MDSRQDTQVSTLKLLLAIRDSNIDEIKKLIDAGADLAQLDESGKTPIEYACALKLWDSVGAIAQSRKTDERDTYHYQQALKLAAEAKMFNVMRQLLDAGASPNCRYMDFASLLHWAATCEPSMIEPFVKHGADLTLRDDKQLTPVSSAAKMKEWGAVATLVRLAGNEVDDQYGYQDALLYAVSNDYQEIAALLLNAGSKTCSFFLETKNTPLHVASINGYNDCMAHLIKHGADLAARNAAGKTPIQVAKNYVFVCQIAKLASTDAKDSYGYNVALRDACIHGEYATAEALLKAGANPNYVDPESKLTMLETAFTSESYKLLKLLVEHGADLSQQCSDGKLLMLKLGFDKKWQVIEEIIQVKRTDQYDTYQYGAALLYAVNGSQSELAAKLLQAGASTKQGFIDSRNTPLHAAVSTGNVEVLNNLIQHGADLADENKAKQTPMQLALTLKNSITKWKLVEAIARAKKTTLADTFHYRDALLEAAKENRHETVNLLLNAGTPAHGSIGTETLLHRAIRDNDEKMIERLIRNGADLAELNSSGQTAMDYAVSLNRRNCVKLMAQLKNNDEKDTYHYADALHTAICYWFSSHDITNALIDGGALNNHHYLKKIIHDGITYEGSSVVLNLVKHGADLAAVDSDGNTPMERLGYESKFSLIKQIANARDADDKDTYRYGSALEMAVRGDEYDAAEALLKAKASKTWTSNGRGILHIAVLNKNLRMLKLLLKHDVNRAKIYNEQTPIEMAARLGLWEYVDAFLEYKTDDKDSYHYAKAAFTYLHTIPIDRKVVNKFIKAGVCKNKANANLLFVNAVERGEVEIAGDLLDAGADVNCQLKRYGSPLHLAVQSHHSTMLKSLLVRGAVQTDVDEQKRTPIELAAALGHWDCVELLVQFNHRGGNDKKLAEDAHYEQALLSAIKSGHYSAVKLLLEAGAPFDRCSLDLGNIALYWAVKNNAKNPEIVSLLLEHGLDASVKNKDGKTMADLAKEWGYTACYQRLNDYRSMIKPGKTAEEYRRDANELYREMQLNSHQPGALPAKIKQLHACYQALLRCDLAVLEQRREELKNKANSKPDASTLLIELPFNVDAEMERINATMMAINTLLNFPDKVPSPTLIHKSTEVEGKDVMDFMQRKSAADDYLLRVRKYLRDLKTEMDRAEFKKKGLFGFWVTGTPTHIGQIRKLLNKLDSNSGADDTYAVFIEIMNIFTSIENSAKRHENTKNFYDHFTRDIKALSFTPVSSALMSEVPLPIVRQPLPAASVMQAQRVVEGKDFTAGYERIYPSVTENSISFPVAQQQRDALLQPVLPALVSFPAITEKMQELLPTGDLIDFSLPASESVEKEDILLQMPDLPQRKAASLTTLFHQPAAAKPDETAEVKTEKKRTAVLG